MTWILNLLTYWKPGGLALLLTTLAFTSWLARERGEERDAALSRLETANARVAMLATAYEQEKERHDFARSQEQKFRQSPGAAPIVLDEPLRAAYDSLRRRQSGRAAR